MFSPSAWTVAALLSFAVILNYVLPLLRNIQVARSTGLKYVVVPWYAYNRVTALLLHRTVARVLNAYLPEPPMTSGRRLVTSTWPWKFRYAPFAALGTDTFWTVAPGGNILHTADANVIADITSRGADFPKPTVLYKSVDIYGKNVVSSEGVMWRQHRKLVAPAFTEKNSQLVFNETLEQTEAMLDLWQGLDGDAKTLRTVGEDTMRLSLNVIGRAGLGRKMGWPSSLKGVEGSDEGETMNNHKLSFTESLHYLLKNIFFVMIFPKWLLRQAPSPRMRKTLDSYYEWAAYMREMLATKRKAVEAGEYETATIDLIGNLVKEQDKQDYEKADLTQTGLSDEEIMGNLFLMTIAGHETSANSIHFSLLLLAMHPEVQKQVQADLDDILRGCKPPDLDYEHDMSRLMNGVVGAVLAEQLRIIAPVITIPKIVSHTPQHLTIDGKDVLIPAKAMIRLCIGSVHSNPKFWPSDLPSDKISREPSATSQQNDLEDFKPTRWLCITKDTETGSHSSTTLYNPPRGAYIPFSLDSRACLGKRFAQVEILAALAVILSQYSVELAVDEWATDEELQKMNKDQKRGVWHEAKQKARWIWYNKMVCVITLQLRGAHIPVRIVKRGTERLFDL